MGCLAVLHAIASHGTRICRYFHFRCLCSPGIFCFPTLVFLIAHRISSIHSTRLHQYFFGYGRECGATSFGPSRSKGYARFIIHTNSFSFICISLNCISNRLFIRNMLLTVTVTHSYASVPTSFERY